MTTRIESLLPGLIHFAQPLRLGDWPTPVERWRGSDDAPHLWIKRDDRAAEFGGTKTRNLEWILGDARRRGRTSLLTVSVLGSHLVHALAHYGVANGFSVRAVVGPRPVDDEVRATLAATLAAGARLQRCRNWSALPLQIARQWRAAAAEGDEPPYWVSGGGASSVGCLGPLLGALELARQVEEGLLPPPDFVFCAAGSCGTLLGLAHGFALAGLQTRVVGIRVVPRLMTSAPRLFWMRARFRRLLGRLRAPTVGARWRLLHRFAGRGYGYVTPQAVATREHASRSGITLETTYTAKAFAGMLDFIARRGLAGRRHVFWNTFAGRTPADRPARIPESFRDVVTDFVE